MTAYFGTAQKEDGEDDPWDFLDAAPAIPEPLPLTETDTEDDASSVKSAPATTALPPSQPGLPSINRRCPCKRTY